MEKEISGLFVYDGSNLLQPVTAASGLPIDQVNFVFSQLVALCLGFVFRQYLSPQKVSTTTRHIFQVIVGLLLTYFCFGSQILHLFLQTSICYILMISVKSSLMARVVFIVAMMYLAMCHIYRVVYDYGGYTLDITGPLMVNTQRLACLAYSLKDGAAKDESKLSQTMRYHATKKWPGVLEFLSYMFCFSTVICGPFCFYKDYMMFIEGTSHIDGRQVEDRKSIPEAPSPVGALIRTLLWTALSGFFMMVLIPKYPITFMTETGFYAMPFLQKTLYMVVSTSLMRSKYYFAWMLGEAANLSCGLGYNGKDSDGNHRWDLLNNAGIIEVETSLSLKVLLDHWNKTTTYWLRYVVYERVHSTLAVFFVSAFWHGFYSGYYITFMSGAIFINTARMFRRKIRPVFQTSYVAAKIYDAITFIGTRVTIAYLVFPFVIMEIIPSMKIYASMYFWFHIVVAITMSVLPFIPTLGPRPKPVDKTQ